jgi:uncharacterized Ntn-hydrolase superfamily protein
MTFAIVAVDSERGLIGVAQTSSPIAVGARCPQIRSGVGAACSQGNTDPQLAVDAIAMLGASVAPATILERFRLSDPQFHRRQVAVLDRTGAAAVHTGPGLNDVAAHATGIGFAIVGNGLTGADVVPRVEAAWRENTGNLLEWRLLDALTAGRDAGGDKFGHRSAVLKVHGAADVARTDLRIDWCEKATAGHDAVDALRTLLRMWAPLIGLYQKRPHEPDIAGSWEDLVPPDLKPAQQ